MVLYNESLGHCKNMFKFVKVSQRKFRTVDSFSPNTVCAFWVTIHINIHNLCYSLHGQCNTEAPPPFHETLWWLEEIGIQRDTPGTKIMDTGEEKKPHRQTWLNCSRWWYAPSPQCHWTRTFALLKKLATNRQKYTVDATRDCTSLFELCVNRWNDLPLEAVEVTTVNFLKIFIHQRMVETITNQQTVQINSSKVTQIMNQQ